MILTDREIQIALESQALIIEPRPSETSFSSTSVDLTLDQPVSIYKDPTAGIGQCVDPMTIGFNHEEVVASLTTQIEIDPSSGYEFKPGTLLLAWTREYIELKTNSKIAARVEGKSSLARLGIGVHITAPVIHAGFAGQVRLEMLNHGKLPVKLRVGMKICQLVFEQTTGTPVMGYKGRFSGQTTDQKG
jgi:dCTP deaminase